MKISHVVREEINFTKFGKEQNVEEKIYAFPVRLWLTAKVTKNPTMHKG